MKKTLLFFFFLAVFMAREGAVAQKILGIHYVKPKQLVTIPSNSDSSTGENFCICKIVAFTSDNNLQRTDAIFAGSSLERRFSKRTLIRQIDFELQQALVFFDSYKLIKQFDSAGDCTSLYKYLKEHQEELFSRSTFLISSYASR